jgi:hypothetical protein
MLEKSVVFCWDNTETIQDAIVALRTDRRFVGPPFVTLC